MKLNYLRKLVKEELKKSLKEDYQDKYKMIGLLVTNIKQRPQKEIYSDIRSITGISVISSKEKIAPGDQNKQQYQTVLTVKVDGYPWIKKGGFNRDKMEEIAKAITDVEGVLSFKLNPDNISPI